MAYQKGSGFVGLRDYLGANRQAGQAMGQQVLGQVNTAQQGVRDLGESTLGQLQQDVSAGVPTYSEPGSAEEAQARAGGAHGTVYRGPQGLTSEQYGALTAGVDKAADVAGYGTTDAGVATLLQQQYGQGYTGVGGRSLDAALARRGAGAQLDAAAKSGIEGLRSYLGNVAGRAASTVEGGRERAADVRRQYGAYQPPAPLDSGTRRNPISTPGTMPDKPTKPNKLRGIGRWLTGGDY